VGSPAPDRSLRQGRPGRITIPIRNIGTLPADQLVAEVSLPPGVVLRGSGGTGAVEDVRAPAEGLAGYARRTSWACDSSPAGATCTLGTLDAGASTDLQLRVFVAPTALPGTLTGAVTSGGVTEQIPPTVLDVLEPQSGPAAGHLRPAPPPRPEPHGRHGSARPA